ncbi:hypothetical protein MKQ68_20695 [Chitinophaga horti]|uniref:DUF4136 domain-containing protein n=1 Tax=Chitinophaga horti TaxID=2920382 RepID=A0ABY6IZ99_9BACT|nr:hypothetical protein [Chitinophaga horti]UYQ92506.1 hypothetical protein MKQ68_20695 [Chitinophaga horti]
MKVVFYTLVVIVFSACSSSVKVAERYPERRRPSLAPYKTFTLVEEMGVSGPLVERLAGENHLLRWELVRMLTLAGLQEAEAGDLMIRYGMATFTMNSGATNRLPFTAPELRMLGGLPAEVPVQRMGSRGAEYKQRRAVLQIYDKSNGKLIWHVATSDNRYGKEKHLKASITATASTLLKKLH